jgi:RNA polymerase sigma-70 factor (ECF subfamily)
MRAEIEKAVALLQENRPDSLERALVLLQQTVFAFSMKVCGQREDAEDTMQDVLLKSVPYLPKFTSPKALVVWLYTVAKNRCLMSRRRSKFAPKENLSLDELMPDRQELDALMQDKQSDPEESVLRAENAALVQQAILKIPPQYRLVLVLHDMEELDSDEIARITGLRPGTVRVRLHRARLFLRRELARNRALHATAAVDSPATKGEAHAPGVAHAPSRVSPSRRRKQKLPRPQECRALFAALSDYLDGNLPGEVCAEMQRHIGTCEPCLAFFDTLRDTVARVRALPPGHPDLHIAADIRSRLLPQMRTALAQARKAAKSNF